MTDKADLKIPKTKRSKFTQPLGKLIKGSRKDTISKLEGKFRKLSDKGKEFYFYLVGDIVTKDFLNNRFLKSYVKLCIIDEKTQRNKIQITREQFFEAIIEFENPAGTISKKSWEMLERAVKSDRRTLIKITKGEEDLLVLPLILKIPLNNQRMNYIVYGQPPLTDADVSIPEGVVLVKHTKQIKKAVEKYIAMMEKVKQH
jgi:uncharacterized protein (UPF0218 family)